MKNTMQHKGYIGSVEFSQEDGVFFGKVMGIRALISYEGTNAQELVSNFYHAVDDYLELCSKEGIKPEMAYKGSFNVRISPELHKQAVLCAASQEITLNRFVEMALQKSIAGLH
ncbi:MAG: type II toxin-antitoxin system HicB family antitoxin [Anaerovoracaceae bacterium]|nr:type II toxin-antitoxin system HicB family antitoxin [Anaerovoracaceae bacterium]